jgi:hypothetical protein
MISRSAHHGAAMGETRGANAAAKPEKGNEKDEFTAGGLGWAGWR